MAASRLRYLVEGTCYETSQLENLQLQSTIFSSHLLHYPQPIALVDFLPTNQSPYLKALKRARSKQSKNIGRGSIRHLLLPRTVRSRRNNNSKMVLLDVGMLPTTSSEQPSFRVSQVHAARFLSLDWNAARPPGRSADLLTVAGCTLAHLNIHAPESRKSHLKC